MGGSVKDVQSKKELDSAVHSGAPVILHFWASWCEASKHMDEVFAHLSTDFPHAHFLRVEAEEQPEISEAYSVSAVPYFAFVKDGKVAYTLEGADPSSLANKVARIAGSIRPGEPAAPASLGMAAGPTILETVQALAKENGSSQVQIQVQNGPADALKRRLQQLIESNPVMLFMKGSPEEPKCGFSQKVVDILKEEKVKFGSFDILLDNEVREGLKKYSNWPTFPQLYCKGELLGGCDIAISMHESGELEEVFRDHGIDTTDSAGAKVTEAGSGKGGISASTGLSETLTSQLESLIHSSPVMLFMKGKPDEPKCGFSRKVVDILVQEKVEFESFDILSDEEVRQGLKVYSNWSSYPQLYIKGELIGGSDIVLEMQKSGELKKVLAEKGIVPKDTLEDRLRKLITSSPVMVFIKGTPDAPRCGLDYRDHLHLHHHHRMAIGQVLHELEVNVSASQAWDLYGSLELAKLVEQALPNLIDKVELIQGDGGVGTILKVTFASGSGVHKEKFTKVDHEKRVKEVEVIEGGLVELGLSLYRVRFEIIEKVEADYSSCCCIIKTTIEFDVKEDAAPNTSSLVSIDPFKNIAEVAKTHLLNKQSLPLPRPS